MATSAIAHLDKKVLERKLKIIEDSPLEQRQEVFKCLGRFMSIVKIQKHIVESFGNISPLNDSFLLNLMAKDPNNKWIIADAKNKYLKDKQELGVFYKKYRLEDLQRLRDKYIEKIENLGVTTLDNKDFVDLANGLTHVLSQAQDEVEGKSASVNIGFGVFDIDDLEGRSDDELISQREELLRKARRAIGVDARTGIGILARPGLDKDNTDSKNVIDTQAIKSS